MVDHRTHLFRALPAALTNKRAAPNRSSDQWVRCTPLAVWGTLSGMAQAGDHVVAGRVADLARAGAAPRSVEGVLLGVTPAAIEMIPGADTAGVLLIAKGGKFESIAGTSDLPHELDELHIKYQEGPCVQ